MTDHIELACSRIDWARQHIEQFNLESERFINSGAYKIDIETKETGKGGFVHSFIFRVNSDIPDTLRFRYGDAIHNLRATCDNLIEALCRPLGTAKQRHFFPCCMEPGNADSGFCKWRTNNSRFGDPILDAIETLQPFNPYSTPEGATLVRETHPIWVLNELWNHDKHKMPLKVSGVDFQGTFAIDLGRGPAGESTGIQSVYFGTIKDGTILAEVPCPIMLTPDNFKAPIAVQIALDENGPIPGMGAHKLFSQLHDFVRNEVVQGLKQFFI